MNLIETQLEDLEVYEAETYRKANIKLLDYAHLLLSQMQTKAILFADSKGIARIANLLLWEAGKGQEFIDGHGIYADQLIHSAIHQLLEHVLGSKHPLNMLFAECLASASDIYLLGKLSQAGQETDFLHDTLESYGSYYELYAHQDEDFVTTLNAIRRKPFETMIALADYLFEFCEPLLYPQTVRDSTLPLVMAERCHFYPLVHHYNISNWILTIRGKHAKPPSAPPAALDAIRALFCDSEAQFLKCMEQGVNSLAS